MDVGQNPVPLVNPKIAGKWMFIPLKMVLIGIDPYPIDQIPFTLDLQGCSQHPRNRRDVFWRNTEAK